MEPIFFAIHPFEVFEKLSSSFFGSLEPDEEGFYTKNDFLFGGPWYAKNENGLIGISANKEMLQSILPQLKLEQTDRAAQIRMFIADLERTKVSRIMHVGGFLRSVGRRPPSRDEATCGSFLKAINIRC